MRQIKFLVVICVAISVGLQVNVLGGKITCANGKPNYLGLMTNKKLTKCIKDIGNPGTACGCILKEVGGTPFDTNKGVEFFKSVLPKKCQSKANDCNAKLKEYKGPKEDPDGKTCMPVAECVPKLCNDCCK